MLDFLKLNTKEKYFTYSHVAWQSFLFSWLRFCFLITRRLQAAWLKPSHRLWPTTNYQVPFTFLGTREQIANNKATLHRMGLLLGIGTPNRNGYGAGTEAYVRSLTLWRKTLWLMSELCANKQQIQRSRSHGLGLGQTETSLCLAGWICVVDTLYILWYSFVRFYKRYKA